MLHKNMVPTAFVGIKALGTYYTQIACGGPQYKVSQNMLFTGKAIPKLQCANPTEEFCC